MQDVDKKIDQVLDQVGEIRKTLGVHGEKLAEHDRRFNEMSEQLDTVAGQTQINTSAIETLGKQTQINTSAIQTLGKQVQINTSAIEHLEKKIDESTEKILTALDKHESGHEKMEREQVAQSVAIARHDKEIITLKQKVGIA